MLKEFTQDTIVQEYDLEDEVLELEPEENSRIQVVFNTRQGDYVVTVSERGRIDLSIRLPERTNNRRVLSGYIPGLIRK